MKSWIEYKKRQLRTIVFFALLVICLLLFSNFVFTDEFGSTALADGFYIMDNNNYIVVSSGIVVQTGVCTIP